MDDGFSFWPKDLDLEYFSSRLNNLHPAIEYTFQKAKLIQSNYCQAYQVLSFLDIEVILHSDNIIETDIYYTDKTTHYYLPYNSAHPRHCEDNLPHNLAKRIIFFVSNDEKVEMKLKELKSWLKDCNYPDNVINQSLFNAKLQGLAPFTVNSKNLPFVTIYYENIDNEKMVRKIRSKLSNIQSRHLPEIFKNKNVILL